MFYFLDFFIKLAKKFNKGRMQEGEDIKKLIKQFWREFLMGGDILDSVEDELMPGLDFVWYELAAILQQLRRGYYLLKKVPGWLSLHSIVY